jgi:hypothetical protein
MDEPRESVNALDAALGYLARGWSVIPIHEIRDEKCSCSKRKSCKHPGKHTKLPTWAKYQKELPTEEDIRFWFGTKWPDANIAIVTGELSGVAVLDVESQEGLNDLKARGYEIPHTPCTRTGGGGWHYLFRYPEGGISNSVKGIATDVDVRGHGGLAILPSSNHISGGVYEWSVTPDEVEFAETPEWMLAAKKGERTKKAKAEPTERLSPNDWTTPVEKGNRNSTATRLAGSAAREGQPEAALLERMREWNHKWCKPPMDADELAQVVASVLKMERERRDAVRANVDQMMAQLETLGHGAKLAYLEMWLAPLLADLPTLDRNSYSKAIAKIMGVQTKDVRALVRPKPAREAARQEVDEATLKLGREFMADLGDHVLERVEEEVREAGLAGEGPNAKLLYLGLTSRLLDRPVSIVVKGTSSSGKSYTVATVLRMFPKSAYIERTGLSPKALAYSDEDFRHRTIVLFEVEGMSDEGEYLLRSLLSEGRIVYETVESTPLGLFPRVIEKEGPTNCFMTTTRASLHPENETRLLSIVANDSPEQTRRVLERMVAPAEDRDYSAWHAAQHWLRVEAAEVTIPFAQTLAKKTAPSAPRMRRDFRSLLSLLRAHALLCQAARERDSAGRIIATVDRDYVVIRELVADVVAQGIRAIVKPEIRETVEAVAYLLSGGKEQAERKGSRVTLVLSQDLLYKISGEGEGSGVNLSHLSTALKLDRSSISRRVKEAEELGYLVNLETRAGRPARLHIGEPMPEDGSVFPSPDELR